MTRQLGFDPSNDKNWRG